MVTGKKKQTIFAVIVNAALQKLRMGEFHFPVIGYQLPHVHTIATMAVIRQSLPYYATIKVNGGPHGAIQIYVSVHMSLMHSHICLASVLS